MELNWRNTAKAAYEAYAQNTGNKNFRGDEMPLFDELPEPIIAAWIAAVQCACDIFGRALIV